MTLEVQLRLCIYPENAVYLFDSTIDELFSKYSELSQRINELVLPERVYITEYPNATLDDDGTFCGFFEEINEEDPSDVPFAPGTVRDFPGYHLNVVNVIMQLHQ